MDRPGVRQVPEGSGEQGKMEKTGCKIICGAPTTFTVKGLIRRRRRACVGVVEGCGGVLQTILSCLLPSITPPSCQGKGKHCFFFRCLFAVLAISDPHPKGRGYNILCADRCLIYYLLCVIGGRCHVSRTVAANFYPCNVYACTEL